ncbi:MAG: hypothetical protein J0M36_06290 [Caulobacterales bacterium]|nr:hypothetical protein [Caulobacterales bacterium]
MDDFVVNIFLDEIRKQARYANAAIAELDELLESRAGGAQPVFRALDEFLGDAARIRSMIWPVRKNGEARGRILREILKLSDDNPLADVTLRNHLEHFDERLDQWAEESKNRIFVDSNIGTRLNLPFQKGETLRHYVPDERVYIFRGDEFAIGMIIAALDDLETRLRHVGTYKSATVTAFPGSSGSESGNSP